MESSLSLLSDHQLLKAYRQAKEKGLAEEFILLLKEEIQKRNLYSLSK
ncbi:MAG TPA: sporulation histidine kinase inhibitor Sda [Chondromyces sp.]|nr:sporulation histidine kinase inhibitor Sda [Chondromyces sp.]